MILKKKRILLIILGLMIVLIAVLTVSLRTKINPTINRSDDLPVIVYNKFDIFEKSKDLYVYQIGEGQHKFAGNTAIHIDIGNNGSLMGYGHSTGEFTENDIYIVDWDGRQQLLDTGVMYYKIAKDSGKIFYYYNDQRDTTIIKQYLDNGQIVDVDKIDCSSCVINNDASTILVTKEHFSDDSEEYINDLYLYEDGVFNLIAENTEYPDSDCISDNGSILFMTGYDLYEGGVLYIKRAREEPELLAEDAFLGANISEDGTMIVFITNEGTRKLHCLYNGQEIKLPDSIIRYYFSRTSNTLAYITSVDGKRHLYKFKNDGAPQKIADAETIAGISTNGSCVLYMDNVEDEIEGDLYAVWDGQQPVLVDTHVSCSFDVEAIMGLDEMFDMNQDGSVILYCKEYDGGPTADLYVKQEGKEPVLVDTRVALGFKLF